METRELTYVERMACEYAQRRLLELFQGRPTPPVERLTTLANEAIIYIYHRMVQNGLYSPDEFKSVWDLRVIVTHQGCGHFLITPVIKTGAIVADIKVDL